MLGFDPSADSLTERVFGFMEEIREEYDLGLQEFIAIQELLIGLASRGALPDDPLRLEGYLRPILCSNRREQLEFSARFREFWLRVAPTPVLRSAPETRLGVEQRVDAWTVFRLRSFVVNAAVCLLVALVLGIVVTAWVKWSGPSADVPQPVASGAPTTPALPITQPAPTKEVPVADNPSPITPQPGVKTTNVAALTGLLVALGVAGLWLRSRLVRGEASSFLQRGAGAAPRDAESILYRVRAMPLVPLSELRRTGGVMRTRTATNVFELDLLASIEATSRRGGLFTDVHRERTCIPEYLFLIDRRHPQDFECARHDELLDLLVQAGTKLTRFYFDRDASVLFAKDPFQKARSIASLAGPFHEHRVAIVADPTTLFDAVTGELCGWLQQLSCWSRPVLFTSSNRDPRLPLMQRLRAAGIPVFDAGPDGLVSAYGQGARGRMQVVAGPKFVTPLPSSLQGDPRAWLAPAPPDDEDLARCLRQWRSFLGPDGYAWLSACALFPQLRWSLALALTEHVASLRQRVTPELARRFASLPWMRAAYLPNWLRRRLVADLSSDERDEIRRAIEQILVSAAEPSASSARLGHEPGLVRAIYRELSREWGKNPEFSSPLEDALYVNSMADDLSVRIPRALRAPGRALTRQARVDVAPRDAIQCAYGGLLLGYFVTLFANGVTGKNAVAGGAAMLLTALFANLASTPPNILRNLAAYARDAGRAALVTFAVLAGAGLAHVNFGYWQSTGNDFSNIMIVVQCLIVLGLPLAVFRDPRTRLAGVTILIGASAIYKLKYPGILWDIAMPPLGYKGPDLQYLEVVKRAGRLALAAAIAGPLFATGMRLRWASWQRVWRRLSDMADRFAPDRLLFDRSQTSPPPASRLNTTLGALGFGVVVGALVSIDWREAAVWERGVIIVSALAFAAYPQLALLRYRAREGGWAVGRTAYEYILATVSAVAIGVGLAHGTTAGLSWKLPLLALASWIFSLIFSRLIRPQTFARTTAFLERTAADRLLGTNPALLGVAYLDAAVIALAVLLGGDQSGASEHTPDSIASQGGAATTGSAGGASFGGASFGGASNTAPGQSTGGNPAGILVASGGSGGTLGSAGTKNAGNGGSPSRPSGTSVNAAGSGGKRLSTPGPKPFQNPLGGSGGSSSSANPYREESGQTAGRSAGGIGVSVASNGSYPCELECKAQFVSCQTLCVKSRGGEALSDLTDRAEPLEAPPPAPGPAPIAPPVLPPSTIRDPSQVSPRAICDAECASKRDQCVKTCGSPSGE